MFPSRALPVLVLALASLRSSPSAGQAGLFVSPDGDDRNPGTLEQPLATLAKAQQTARELRGKDIVGDQPLTIYLRGGLYELDAPLELTAEDSGTLSSPLVWAAYGDEQPMVSAGRRLSDLEWQAYRDGVYRASVEGPDFDQLFIDGQRQHMARFPDFDSDEGWAFGGTSPEATSPERVKTWAHPETGYVHALHAAQWGSHHFRITGVKRKGELKLEGGWQENRPQNGTHKEFVMVENIFEELDAPGEWFLDRENGRLYVYPPENVELSSAELMVSGLKQLVLLRGTPEAPIHHVEFRGIRFSHTARVFMEPHDKITRGDWGVARFAAAYVEGAEDCRFVDCRFENLGGTAVYVRDYNRRVNVEHCLIHDVGEAGVLLIGDVGNVHDGTTGYYSNAKWKDIDMRPGPKSPYYPAECRIHGNLMYDLGRVNKQTASGVFLSVSESIQVTHNTVFKCPRSGMTVNDGAFGGHIIEHNDIFATVRETGDHGPFNSWGRDRHWQTRHAGRKKGDQEKCRLLSRLDNHHPTVIRNNRFSHTVGTHSFGIDLDDGSSNYLVYNNLTLGCSFKLREGFYRVVENNIFVGPFPPGKHVCFEDNQDIIRRNIIVNTMDRDVFSGIGFIPSGIAQWDYNLYYSQAGAPVFKPGVDAKAFPVYADSMSLTEWQAAGLDRNSVVADPLFVDPEAGDYRVRPESPALALGFKNFPMDQFGVQRADYEATAQEGHAIYDHPFAESSKTDEIDDTPREFCGATVKNVSTMDEVTASAIPGIAGVIFLRVPEESAAAEYGFKVGDVVLSTTRDGWRKQLIRTFDDLVEAIEEAGKEPLDLSVDGNKPPRILTVQFKAE
ncbi:MAG: peptide-binding protein [bacterium]|nr:peptide-binding protein [bacterium]